MATRATPRAAAAPAKRKQLTRAERSEQILWGAARAFAASGFAATSMDDVAAACGVSRLLVYRHFDSKEDLYRAILQRVFDRHVEELVASMEAGPRRGTSIRTVLNVARSHPDGFVLLWRHAAREPQFAGYARDQRRQAATAVAHLLTLDTADPTLDRWSAEMVFTWLLESVLTWLEVGDPARDDEMVERATAGLLALRSALLEA
ncbi:MAG TPA: helix-turn-helix domain-containing protein [Acidimicrobiales bacterium]|nr:helix-turn-helix domain-containing protein [Acidimicrobiales bacterium]